MVATYTSPAYETAETTCDDDCCRSCWGVAAGVGKKLLGALVRDEVYAGPDRVPHWSIVSNSFFVRRRTEVVTYADADGIRSRDP
jgi:hypothetical protein